MMITYKEFRPTGFDTPGLSLPDRQDWLVAPVGRNRDSGPLDRANFDAMLEALGGESDHVEVCNFGHWACGWFEIILIDPAAENLVKIAEEAESALEDYCILDEEKWSEYEWEEMDLDWDNYGREEFRDALTTEFALDEDKVEKIEDMDSDKLDELWCEAQGMREFAGHSTSFFVEEAAKEVANKKLI